MRPLRTLVRVWLAFRISFLEARIQFLRQELGERAAKLDDARRHVNLLHQRFAAVSDGRQEQTVYQLRGRSMTTSANKGST